MVRSKREELIVNNIPLVHAVARRFRGRGEEYDDLFQAGCLGLIKAADRFDEGRGFQFSTYAVPVIMGEIRRLFRDGGQLKVSRSLREKSAFIQKLRDEFIAKENREPTVSELSRLSGIEEAQLGELLGIITPPVSLCAGSEGERELDIPVDYSDEMVDRLSVKLALEGFSERDRRLIELRYFHGKTQSDTAKLLGISQVQVSRLEKALLLKLRDYLM